MPFPLDMCMGITAEGSLFSIDKVHTQGVSWSFVTYLIA